MIKARIRTNSCDRHLPAVRRGDGVGHQRLSAAAFLAPFRIVTKSKKGAISAGPFVELPEIDPSL